METNDRIRLGFEHWAKSQGYNCEKIADLHAALARSTERNARLANQCRDHDTRRAAAVAQAAALAADVDRLNDVIVRLAAEGQDAQEM